MSEKKKIYRMQLNLDQNTLAMLDDLARDRYRDVDRTKALRWCIRDIYEMEKKGKEKVA